MGTLRGIDSHSSMQTDIDGMKNIRSGSATSESALADKVLIDYFFSYSILSDTTIFLHCILLLVFCLVSNYFF